MITYNEQAKIFEITESACENYITLQYGRSKSWNKPQLDVIVETLVNFMNVVFEIYQNYPGNIVELFKKLLAINTLQYDTDKRFIKEILNNFRRVDILFAMEFLEYIRKPYQMCIGYLYNMELNRGGLQTHYAYTDEQMQDLRQIIGDFLGQAIQFIESHLVYQQAKKDGHLVCNLEKAKALSYPDDRIVPGPFELTAREQLQLTSNQSSINKMANI